MTKLIENMLNGSIIVVVVTGSMTHKMNFDTHSNKRTKNRNRSIDRREKKIERNRRKKARTHFHQRVKQFLLCVYLFVETHVVMPIECVSQTACFFAWK